MANVHIGINMEFVRHDDKSFESGIKKAAEFGSVDAGILSKSHYDEQT